MYPNNQQFIDPNMPNTPNGQVPPLMQPNNQAINQPPAGATPVVKTNPNSTQNSLLISEIRDGIVIMNDGSYRSVVMCKSINFDLMSAAEKEGVEFSYQQFLNQLYFPVQISIRSQKIDLSPYIDKLVKIRSEHDNMLLAMLMDDYINFIGGLAEQTNIMDKRFYIVIPYFSRQSVGAIAGASKNFFTNVFGSKENKVVIDEAELQKAKTELRNRVQSILASLNQAGIQALPLDTQELIELYYDFYNPDTATRQPLKNFNDLTAPVVTKGEGMAYQSNLSTGEM